MSLTILRHQWRTTVRQCCNSETALHVSSKHRPVLQWVQVRGGTGTQTLALPVLHVSDHFNAADYISALQWVSAWLLRLCFSFRALYVNDSCPPHPCPQAIYVHLRLNYCVIPLFRTYETNTDSKAGVPPASAKNSIISIYPAFHIFSSFVHIWWQKLASPLCKASVCPFAEHLQPFVLYSSFLVSTSHLVSPDTLHTREKLLLDGSLFPSSELVSS